MANLTVDGSTTAVLLPAGGDFVGEAKGTFGGGTMTLEIDMDSSGTFVSAGTAAALTANGLVAFKIPKGNAAKARWTLSGSSGANVAGNIYKDIV